MKGLILNVWGPDYLFLLDRIEVNMESKKTTVGFRLYLNDVITNKMHYLTKEGLDLDWGNISGYYRLLCIDLKVDPSIVPDGMEG